MMSASGQPLRKIAEGREAEIFAWEDGTVLRLLRNPDGQRQLEWEVANGMVRGGRGSPGGSVGLPRNNPQSQPADAAGGATADGEVGPDRRQISQNRGYLCRWRRPQKLYQRLDRHGLYLRTRAGAFVCYPGDDRGHAGWRPFEFDLERSAVVGKNRQKS